MFLIAGHLMQESTFQQRERPARQGHDAVVRDLCTCPAAAAVVAWEQLTHAEANVRQEARDREWHVQRFRRRVFIAALLVAGMLFFGPAAYSAFSVAPSIEGDGEDVMEQASCSVQLAEAGCDDERNID